MRWMYPFGGGFFMMGFWWILLLAVIVLAIGRFSGKRRNFGVESSPMEILKRRYARGEISKEEFEEKKRDLS